MEEETLRSVWKNNIQKRLQNNMGEPSPYQYTYKDIERYHSGQMPADEMHRMERAALDDPFLADALEGYTRTSTASSDLEKLNHRLNERAKRRATVLWISKKYNALKVAAVLLFVIAGSWFLIVSKQKPSSDLALEKRTIPVNNKVIQAQQDSIELSKTNDTNKAVSTNEAATAVNAAPKKKPKYQFNKENNRNDVAIVTPKRNIETTQPATNVPSAVKDNVSTAQVAPSVPLANARAFKAESKLNKDSTDKFSGYASNAKKQTTDTIKNMDVVLKPQAVPNLSEVVVTKAKESANRKDSRSPFAIKDTLEPEDGWDEYNDYIANNIKNPEETRAKRLTGEVELSFDVNRDGRPINIKVEKSLCDPCDTEAIRLLKEGPKWKQKKNRKGKLKIHF
jgi:TonB family C-terminal domain